MLLGGCTFAAAGCLMTKFAKPVQVFDLEFTADECPLWESTGEAFKREPAAKASESASRLPSPATPAANLGCHLVSKLHRLTYLLSDGPATLVLLVLQARWQAKALPRGSTQSCTNERRVAKITQQCTALSKD